MGRGDHAPRLLRRLAERDARRLGEVSGLVHAAGVLPSQASPATLLRVDLYGTALVLEKFGRVIARGGSGVVIASQSGHRLPPLTAEQNKALAMANSPQHERDAAASAADIASANGAFCE